MKTSIRTSRRHANTADYHEKWPIKIASCLLNASHANYLGVGGILLSHCSRRFYVGRGSGRTHGSFYDLISSDTPFLAGEKFPGYVLFRACTIYKGKCEYKNPTTTEK